MGDIYQADISTPIIKAGSYAGAGISIGSALTLSEVGVIIGIVTAIATFALNVWHIRRRHLQDYRRETREIEEHLARMRQLGVPESGLHRRQGGKVESRIAIALLSLSAAGLLGILTREDIKTDAYPDPVHGWSVPTIGAGSTAGVKRGDTITPLAAVRRTVVESAEKERAIKRCLAGVALHQHEYDAYVRLAHNIGEAEFCGSTVAGRARAGDYAGACEAILLFDRAGQVKKPSDRCSHPDNRTCRGLWRDRQETRALCLGVLP